MPSLSSGQKSICEKYGAQYVPCDANLMVGISKSFDPQNFPINGLRHPLLKNTTGWYIWSGEQFSLDPDFFIPIHAAHLNEQYGEIIKYLGLAPGWRFLFAPSQEDVWFDEQLLQI
jgi:hypothetical protein